MHKQQFAQKMRNAALKGAATTQWEAQFEKTASAQRKLIYFETFQGDKEQLLVLADRYANNSFSILGSQQQTYKNIPWYTDVRLQQHNAQADCLFDSTSFYADIQIDIGIASELSKDIKVPWELARFAYAPILSVAYAATQDAKYLSALKNQISSWLDATTFLHGIHWLNPMEVAIRATNWIIAYQHVQTELQEDDVFHKRLICSLWDHMRFIENNWEWYDGRTNNHYLSNLVGYAYLCWFFKDPSMHKRWKNCFQELQSELEWQVFEEGTSYEGSTRYHALVTELFLHGFLIAQQMGETISKSAIDKVDRMIQFGELTKNIVIGDDDSGFLMHPVLQNRENLFSFLGGTRKKKKDIGIFQYPAFGISIIETDLWHISVRHHAYQAHQPTAHFHEDIASITMSYKGIPILVDSGTYVYTASSYWRNCFRSLAHHNTFYPIGWDQKKDTDLFSLDLPQANAQYKQTENSVRTTHSLFGYPVSRSVQWTNDLLIIQDDISHANEPMIEQFIFSPEIELQKNNVGGWDILYANQYLMRIYSDVFTFQKTDVWVSPAYGVKQKSWALKGHIDGAVDTVTIQFLL